MIYLITNLKHKAGNIAKNTQHKLQLLVNNHCNPVERITSLLFLSHSSSCFMCGQSSFCYNVMSKIVDVNIRMWTIDTIPLNTGKRSPIKFCCSVGQQSSRVLDPKMRFIVQFSTVPDTRNVIQWVVISAFHQSLL